MCTAVAVAPPLGTGDHIATSVKFEDNTDTHMENIDHAVVDAVSDAGIDLPDFGVITCSDSVSEAEEDKCSDIEPEVYQRVEQFWYSTIVTRRVYLSITRAMPGTRSLTHQPNGWRLWRMELWTGSSSVWSLQRKLFSREGFLL